jgi:hypothetical protein
MGDAYERRSAITERSRADYLAAIDSSVADRQSTMSKGADGQRSEERRSAAAATA